MARDCSNRHFWRLTEALADWVPATAAALPYHRPAVRLALEGLESRRLLATVYFSSAGYSIDEDSGSATVDRAPD